MRAHIEFIFRPRNALHRFLAWIIGAPTVGIIRAGENMVEFGDDYEASAVFVAPDHQKAEIKALASPVRFSMYTATKRALAAVGMRIRWDRRKAGGRIVKIDPR